MEEEVQEIIIEAPLFLQLSSKPGAKKYHINLNQYRNWHYQVNNNIKQKYKDVLADQLTGLRFENKIELTFILWKSSRRKVDRANPLCIHEKFFCDALVEHGCIEDDNDDYVHATHYYTGGIDRENPRVDIIIREVI